MNLPQRKLTDVNGLLKDMIFHSFEEKVLFSMNEFCKYIEILSKNKNDDEALLMVSIQGKSMLSYKYSFNYSLKEMIVGLELEKENIESFQELNKEESLNIIDKNIFKINILLNKLNNILHPLEEEVKLNILTSQNYHQMNKFIRDYQPTLKLKKYFEHIKEMIN